MPEKSFRRRTQVTGGRKSRQPNPSPSPRRRTPPPRRSVRQGSSKPIRILKRCSSDPMLWSNSSTSVSSSYSDDDRSLRSEGGVLYRPQTCTDVFGSSSSFSSLPGFSSQTQSYEVMTQILVFYFILFIFIVVDGNRRFVIVEIFKI